MGNVKRFKTSDGQYHYVKDIYAVANVVKNGDTVTVTKRDGTSSTFDVGGSYTVAKLATPESGYASTYQLQKNGTAVGANINIPKDYLVKSATLNTCSTADTPVSGYVVGDKYIDFVINTAASDGNVTHLYLLVSDLVDAYTAGNGITISNNVVSAKVVTANGLTIDATNGISFTHPTSGVTPGTYTQVTTDAQGHVTTGANPSTISGYGILDAYTKTEVDTALSGKVSTEQGKGLSANDFTNTLKTKLEGISAGAEVNVNADWNASSGDAQILNKPTTVAGYGITDTYTKTEIDSALSGKVNTESGKGLSSNDFTTALKTKLEDIEPITDAEIIAIWSGNS